MQIIQNRKTQEELIVEDQIFSFHYDGLNNQTVVKLILNDGVESELYSLSGELTEQEIKNKFDEDWCLLIFDKNWYKEIGE